MGWGEPSGPALGDVPDATLLAEVERRALIPCRCRKWTTYMGAYDSDGYTLRCHGCRRSVGSCTCS